MKILWLTNIPSPYRMNFFNKLGTECNLTVIFERNSASNRDLSWKEYNMDSFTGVFLNGIKYRSDSALSFGIIRYLSESYDHIVVSNPLTMSGILAIMYLKLTKKDYIIVGDGGQPKYTRKLKELLKKRILSGAALYLSTGNEHEKYYLNYGAEKERITKYPFTSISDDDILDKPVSIIEKERIKKKLGISQQKIVLSVGRFVYEKGFDVLLKAGANLDYDTAICLIGGKPGKDYQTIINELNLNNVYFIDYLKKEELSEYFKASDVFVLPTRGDAWGLVINEAMAYGLPIITTNKCVAGLELIDDYQNGFIVPVDDYGELYKKIQLILNNKSLSNVMSRNNLSKISAYTLEKMVRKHIDVFRNMGWR